LGRRKCEQDGEVVKVNVCGYKTYDKFLQALYANLVDKYVAQSLGHAGSCQVEFEEATVVALDKSISHFKSMLDVISLFLFWGQGLEHAERLRLQLTKNVVQELVT